MTELYKYRKHTTIEVKAKDSVIEQLDLTHQIPILENELYHRYVNLILPKEDLIQHGIYLQKGDSNNYQMDILIRNQNYKVEGELQVEGNQCKILTLRLLPHTDAPEFRVEQQEDEISESSFPVISDQKATVQNEPVSNTVESSTVVENSKESKAVLKLWMDIVNQKSTFLSFQREDDWNILSYSEYTSLEVGEKEYPLLYQLDNQYIKVVFEDGDNDDFMTEFCAKVYAVMHPSDLKIQSDLRNLDRLPEANDKILKFVESVIQAGNSEHIAILSQLKIKSIQKMMEQEIKETTKGGILNKISLKK